MQKFTLASTAQRLTLAASSWLEEVLFDGAFAVDGTVGNGYDTVFLAHRVGPSGKVLGFDVQKAAIGSAREVLKFVGSMDRVTLILDSHSEMEKYLPPGAKIHGAMFNLGYLPRGSREIVTRPETTIPAVKTVIRHLAPGGRLTVLAYRGHAGGIVEYEALHTFFTGVAAEECIIDEYAGTQDPPEAPRLFRIQKIERTPC
jgi:16S rRNA C1402 N4-methylase RsmH